MRPVKELADVVPKLEVLEDIVEQLQGVIADIKNVLTKCSSWIDEKDDTAYKDISQMLVSKTCEYVKQLFLMAHEKNGKLSEPVYTEEEMNTVSGIQTIEAPGSDIKGSLDYKRLQESVKEITASIKSHSEMIEVLQKRNKSLEKGNMKEIAANVKKHSDMIESLQERNKSLENISEILSTQNQSNETICAEHYKEIIEELSVASSFMSNLKDENIKLKLELKDYNKKVDDVSERVYKGMEIVSEFAKDQHILNELQKRNKELTDQSTKDQHHLDELRKQIQKLTDDSVELNQHLDNTKESIERLKEENVQLRQHLDNSKESIETLKEENAKHQASLETKEFENQKLTEKLGFFPKDILKRCKTSLIDVRKKNYNFLLFGTCGFGKSALGNSILQRKCFKVGFSLVQIHTEVQCEMGEFNGRGIRVFEFPDPYFDNHEKQSKDLLFKVTKDKIVDQCSHGFSVIFFVHRCDRRVYHENSLLIEAFKITFGQNSLKDYGILVMTHGDCWKIEYEEEKSFQDWIQHEGNFKKILTEFNGRALLFDNRTYVKEEQTEQLQTLMDMVDKLILDHTFQTKSLMF